jgi:outer membrane immunogenic protein
MKKLVLALAAVAAFAGSAFGADLPARTFTKAAAPVAYVPSWTGCYLGGGGGYGLWNDETTGFVDGPPRVQATGTATAGGRGYLGTVQGGCDYQFAALGANVVVGAFGDYDLSSLKGNLQPAGTLVVGNEKMSSAWSVGGRAGWLVTPRLLTYFSAGYTEATFDRVDFQSAFAPVPAGVFFDKQTYKGYFIGAGDEYALGFLPGLFWKTEYRFSHFDTKTNPFVDTATGLPVGQSEDSKKWVQTVRSELTYHFNWGGPVMKY